MPGLVRWVLGFVRWVLRFVSWLPGIVFWVFGVAFWVSGMVFWVSATVFWVWNCQLGVWNCQLGVRLYQMGAWVCHLGVWFCQLGVWNCQFSVGMAPAGDPNPHSLDLLGLGMVNSGWKWVKTYYARRLCWPPAGIRRFSGHLKSGNPDLGGSGSKLIHSEQNPPQLFFCKARGLHYRFHEIRNGSLILFDVLTKFFYNKNVSFSYGQLLFVCA